MSVREVPTRFAVAFSLAGEQRQLVLPIAQEVEAILGRSTVFYDDWYEHWIAGSDADLLLQELYGRGTEPGSTDDIEGWQPFSQVRPPLSLPGGCTYQVQPSTAPIRALTCLNTDKPEKASVDRG